MAYLNLDPDLGGLAEMDLSDFSNKRRWSIISLLFAASLIRIQRADHAILARTAS